MRVSRWRKPAPGWFGIAVIVTVGCLFAFVTPADTQQGNDETCLECHDVVGEEYHLTSHGIYLSGSAMPAEGSCQSCHGPGDAHIDSGDPADIINPATMDEVNGESTCLTCHAGHEFEDWSSSAHRSAGVRCADCHKGHVAIEDQSQARVSDRCMGCHAEQRAAGYMPSHHPVAEGKLECNDCHDVHGGSGTFVMDGSVREKCFQCHAGMEGPFLFEHPPVAEDCSICHTPHGSVANNLLKQGEPALCLNCHAMHFHAAVEGVDGPFDDPQAPERAGVSTPDAWKRVMLTKCTQCHTEIHGSDLPSQSISGQGKALTR